MTGSTLTPVGAGVTSNVKLFAPIRASPVSRRTVYGPETACCTAVPLVPVPQTSHATIPATITATTALSSFVRVIGPFLLERRCRARRES